MIARYTLFYIGLFLAFSILSMVVFTVLDLEGNSALSVVLVMFSAMMIGQVFVKEQRRALSKKERHQLAAAFTLSGTVASVVLLIAVFAVLGGAELLAYYGEIFSEMAGVMIAITVFVLFLHYGINWLGLGLGVKAALKQQVAKAAKE